MVIQGSQCCDYAVDWSAITDLCEIMPSRLVITGLLIQWLRSHFSDEDNLESAKLFENGVLWNEDIEDTQIVIDSVFLFNPAQSEYRPGIFVKPGTWKAVNYGIDDRKTISVNKGTGCCLTQEIHNAFFQGSHVIFCIGGDSAEVEILAGEVYRELMHFSPVARGKFGFVRFKVSEVGELSILEEATQNYVIPIVVSYGVQEVWRVCPIE